VASLPMLGQEGHLGLGWTKRCTAGSEISNRQPATTHTDGPTPESTPKPLIVLGLCAWWAA
jgi:hypothetical protein